MKSLRSWALVTVAAALLAACGGGGDGDQSPRVKYSKVVSFGDSYSDVGSYATAGLVAATAGGKYTVNGSGNKIWVELIAAQLGVAAPCAAQTGLESTGPFASFAQPVTNKAGCFAYGQGGSRVTNPIGPWNKALLGIGDPTGALGQLTDPLVNQIGRHLAASGGSFAGDELVTLFAGGNDMIANLSAVLAGAATPTEAVTAMGVAGAEMAAYVKSLIVAKGAKRILVLNLADFSRLPYVLEAGPAAQALAQAAAGAFNAQLSAGLAGTDGVLLVDFYTEFNKQFDNPAQYGLTNVTARACDRTKAVAALFCSAATLIAGDVSRYAFADDAHPTPYGHQLIAQLVSVELIKKGWL